MQDALFSGLFGALTTEHRMNHIANNLANVNTHGYKRDALAFSDTMAYYAHDEIREPLRTLRSGEIFPEPKNIARPRMAVNRVDFAQGAMKVTGDPLDVAISGENAFFKVETPNGEYLTRDGHFVLANDGTIMTPQGYTLQGTGGAIQVPPGTRHITISGDGQVVSDEELIGRIQLFSVNDLKKMVKFGHNLFMPQDGAEVTEGDGYASGARLEQGFVEAANVEVVTEMVKMIETSRQFEAYQKVMQTADALDRAANDRVGKRVG